MAEPSPLALIFPELERLIPRLGSSYDGEVLGVAREIRRVLAGAGIDFNDLVAALRRDAGIVDPVPKPSPVKLNMTQRRCAWFDLANVLVKSCNSTPAERLCARQVMIALSGGFDPPPLRIDEMKRAFSRVIGTSAEAGQ